MGVIQVGTKIDHYVVESVLGEGGMGEVFLAKDLNLDRKVAIKTLIPNKSSEKLQKRFENEAKILASLNHNNIVSVYNYGQYEGIHYMVMEFIQGQDLSAAIKSRGFGIGECLEAFQQMVEGILEAHNQGVLHRDIKPANLVIDNQGRVKVVDFGISKDFKKEDVNLTDMGRVIGTTNYMAPELFVGQRPSVTSDIFSMGIVLFEMLEGFNPFTAETRYETMENIRNKEVQLSKEVARIVPPVIEKILYKMLAKDPDQRYQNLTEVRQDFQKIDMSTIPNELMAARRPEVMILNEQKIRLKLLSQGYATREIGIILSLAAQIQEKDEPLSEKTEVVDEVIKRKVSLSQEALESAIRRFKNAQSRLSSTREVGFGQDITSVIQQHYKNLSVTQWAAAGAFVIAIMALGIWWSGNSQPDPILTLQKPAPKVSLAVGAQWTTRTRVLNENTGELVQDTSRQVTISKNELGDKITETEDLRSGQRAISSLSVSPFLPSHTYQTVAGDEGEQIILGDYDKIFPLQIGSEMNFEAKGKSKWDGEFRYKKNCKVTGKEILSLEIGQTPTWVVVCRSFNGDGTLEEDRYRKFFYSPKHGNFVRVEARRSTGKGVTLLETKEWVDVSNYIFPSY